MPVKNEFEFDIDQKVQITRSGEVGFIDGYAKHKNCGNRFYVKYTKSSGDSAECWVDADDLTAVPAK
ncbi:MAG: hypothetical protein ACRC1V_11790 [Plesiomonas sp.]|nr:hypothetical protein [Plesiomonas shigelloides]